MKIEVRFRGVDSSEALRAHTKHRIHVHLSRFGSDIESVQVRIEDVNGPKGGVDKRCKITVRGPRCGTATLDELHDNAYAGVDLAVQRVSQVVAREIERQRSRRQAPRRAAGPAAGAARKAS